jgi:hypothetical protein
MVSVIKATEILANFLAFLELGDKFLKCSLQLRPE